MSTGEGKSKKSKKTKVKLSLALPENYIQDKAKMATDTLNRMNKSKILYGELLKLVHKQSVAAQELCSIGEQVSDVLSKLGSLHPGDLGLVLRDMASYTSEIDGSMKNWSSSLYNEFVVPISRSMDPHLKEISDKTKEVKLQTNFLVKQMAVVEKDVQKAGKVGQNQLVEAMEEFNRKKDETDKKKAEILLDVLLMERQRYIFLIEHYLKTLQGQIFLGRHMEAMTKEMQSWRDICYTKNALSEEQITALTTASEQTFRQVGNSSDQENTVILFKSTSLGLKNLTVDGNEDHEKVREKEAMRRVKSSNYVSRAKQKNDTWLDSIISPREALEEVDVDDVPVGFPPAPEKVSEKFEGSDREGYKVWMRKKVDYDTWVNSLRVYRKREKEGNSAACVKIIDSVLDQLSHPASQPITLHIPPTSSQDGNPSPRFYSGVSTLSTPIPTIALTTPVSPLHATSLNSPPLHATSLNSPPLRAASLNSPPLHATSPHSPPLHATSPHSPPLHATSPYSPPLHATSPYSPPLHDTSPYSPPLQPTEADMYSPSYTSNPPNLDLPVYLMNGLVSVQPQYEENGDGW